MLLPVTVLLRRAYAVHVIGAALTARAQGSGFPAAEGVPFFFGNDRVWLADVVSARFITRTDL